MSSQRSRITRRFVKLLEDYMAKHGCSQTVAGAKVGISQNYVSKLVKGTRNEITAEVLERAIERLKMLPDYFFDDDVEELGKTYEDYTLAALRDAARRRDGSGPRHSPLRAKG